MGQKIEEQLSALLDAELPVEEEELLLRRLGQNLNSSTAAQIASAWSSPLDESEVISSASVPDPTPRTAGQSYLTEDVSADG